MKARVFVCLLVLSWFLPIGGLAGQEQGQKPGVVSPLEKGIGHFKTGFYELLPKGRKAEADREFAMAVRSFQQVLASSPDDAAAHRHLARVYSVQEKHLLSAGHFQRAGDLDPFDVDAPVLAASEFAEAGRFAEARTQLEIAKGRTDDSRARKTIDGYLLKLVEAERDSGKDK